MIQVSDSSELVAKTTKGALADFAELEAKRIERQQLWWVLAFIPVVVLEFFLRKAGWFVLPTVAVLAAIYRWLDVKAADLKGRSLTYKKLKAIHSKRPQLR